MEVMLYTDGGSRNNPGDAGIGVVIMDNEGNIIKEIGEYIGVETNNVAEYKAFIRGLEECLNLGYSRVKAHLDSQLIVKQILGEYKVKNKNLKVLYEKAKNIIKKIEEFEIVHIKRALNKKADYLVNKAIDKKNTSQTQLKLKQLKTILKDMESIAVAFSGGVDSTFLLNVAKEVLGDKVIAITVNAFIHAKRELEESKKYADQIRVKHIILQIDNINIKEFVDNTPDRCYYCKREIFTKIKEIAKKYDVKYIVDGSNVDDLKDFRPGMRALKELKIISPLKEVGLTKNEIRQLSKELNIPTWDKPSFACLASRIPYNNKITKEKLNMIELSEEFLLSLGFKQVRVRHHGEIARIEILKDDMNKFFDLKLIEKVNCKFKKIGFDYVTLDLSGYRTGSMNETL
ncbi:ATP-dependent sacrificial sulfur transferase LarE [Tepidibacter thalassicus]|uniref:TIGR00268 family protein n=1 Tax=Tepidibacter thalassicus DSM 15285 TaxID=1123350 RepID=A0A1M5P4N1_9FIRM|nr:ATP-dependent sacrificial sulfur transferase LarE [Tepidibacter thalassicus]SHG96153.1 TIGR00268 family protein [Tepidibacter thalassicus DSM 15285]